MSVIACMNELILIQKLYLVYTKYLFRQIALIMSCFNYSLVCIIYPPPPFHRQGKYGSKLWNIRFYILITSPLNRLIKKIFFMRQIISVSLFGMLVAIILCRVNYYNIALWPIPSSITFLIYFTSSGNLQIIRIKCSNLVHQIHYKRSNISHPI